MKYLEEVMKDYLDVSQWGASRKNPKTGEPEPISGDRVRKLIPKIKANNPKHVFFDGKYRIYKNAPDPRKRDSNGNIHIGVPKGTVMKRKDKDVEWEISEE